MEGRGAGFPGSSIVVAMARNGTDFGIRVAGTGGRWFTAPAAVPHGLYLGGFGPGDANLGDDADTTGAVCGQLAGALHGERGIPAAWLERLAMRREIGLLAERLVARPFTSRAGERR